MGYSQIIISSLLVSLDALFVGLAIGNIQKFNFFKFIISIILITLIIFTGYFLALIIKQYYEIDLTYFSCIVFLIFGLKSLFTREKSDEKNISFKGLLLLNFTLSLDGSILAFSTAFSNETLLLPIFICLFHYILLFSGWIFSSILTNKFKYSNIVSGLSLITLAILKFFGVI